MAIKRPKPEEIIVKLRQIEVLMGQGMPRIDTIRQISGLNKPITVGKRNTVEWSQNNSRN